MGEGGMGRLHDRPPFIGVLAYLIAQHDGMAQRQADAMSQAQQQTDEYIRSVATNGGGAADQIAKGKELLDSGAISQAEFDSLKARALGAA